MPSSRLMVKDIVCNHNVLVVENILSTTTGQTTQNVKYSSPKFT